MSTDNIVIDVQSISKRYKLYNHQRDRAKQFMLSKLHKLTKTTPPQYFRDFWALNDISFQVKRGETIGIIGKNGSGKSTLLQIIAGTIAATKGTVNVSGRIAALLELGSGFNMEFTGKENIFFNGYVLGLKHKEILDCYDQIIEFADIGEHIDQPVKTYSSGMFVRLAFAVQAHVNASVLIIDEALAVGDVFFRQKCYARLKKLKESGASILIVSHAMTDIEQYCDRAVLLEHGNIRYIGDAGIATKHYYLSFQDKQIPLQMPKSNEKPILSMQPSNNVWSTTSIFTDASKLTQVNNGIAQCIRFAVCDLDGNLCSRFDQGETAVFYSEFLTLQPIAIPLGGVVLSNDQGVIVHGKSSLEYDIDVVDYIEANTLVRCCQKIELKLHTGEFSFELGFCSISSDGYKNRSNVSYDELSAHIFRLCHLPNAGVLSVGLRTEYPHTTQITHHGIADLPGDFEFCFAK